MEPFRVRRVVTEVDGEGRSIVASDGAPPGTITAPRAIAGAAPTNLASTYAFRVTGIETVHAAVPSSTASASTPWLVPTTMRTTTIDQPVSATARTSPKPLTVSRASASPSFQRPPRRLPVPWMNWG